MDSTNLINIVKLRNHIQTLDSFIKGLYLGAIPEAFPPEAVGNWILKGISKYDFCTVFVRWAALVVLFIVTSRPHQDARA